MGQTQSNIGFASGQSRLGGWLAIIALLWGASATALSPPATGALTQYTAGGHVLGFDRGGYVVSNGTYALQVRFEHAAAVAPTAVGEPGTATLGRVSYAELWRGIGLAYDNPDGGIVRSTWTLDPGADPAAICLRYNRAVELLPSGALRVPFASGAMTESRPVAWQDAGGRRRPVEVAFVQLGRDVVGFRVGAYRRDLPLVIDPTLTWNTFLGGSGGDIGQAIAIDGGSGDVYVTGYGTATWGSPVNPYATGGDAFVARLSATGALIWNTFIGGSGEERAYGVAVDGAGSVYVTGISGAAFGSPVRAFSALTDVFVVRLAPGGTLAWNTFLGGGDFDIGHAIAVDGGDVYVSGYSNATWGSPVGPYAAGGDAFAARLTSAGALTWNTFLGGSSADSGEAIVVDGGAAVYVTGHSGATWGSPLRAYTALNDAFVARLTTSGGLTWNTFLGGSGHDAGDGIGVDDGGNVYVAGASGATWGSPVRAYESANDVFAARLTAAGALSWNTFLGDSGEDFARALAVDGNGSVYVAGHSDATWGSPISPYSAGIDGFGARLTSTGALAWSAFFGGASNDFGSGIAIDANGDAYVAGHSTGDWGSPIRAYTASIDAIALQLTGASPCPTIPAPGCVAPGVGGKSLLQIRTDPDDPTGGKDKLKWKFKGGPALAQADFGDPTTATSYALCIYDDSALEVTVDVPPGDTTWKPVGGKGYLFKDPNGSADGVTGVKLFGGAAGKGKLQTKGRGANLPPLVPASPTTFFANQTSVVVQLHESDGDCYETEFTAADERKNDGTQFTARR
jgi:hypothetical protein